MLHAAIDRDALGAAHAFQIVRVGNPVAHLPRAVRADADAARPTGMRRDAVGFGVRHVERVAQQRDAARPAELLHLGNEAAVQVEHLDAVVAAIGNPQKNPADATPAGSCNESLT
jgi:hypothetical protein